MIKREVKVKDYNTKWYQRFKSERYDISTVKGNKFTLSSNDDKIIPTFDCKSIFIWYR